VHEVGSPKFYVIVRVEGRTNDIPYVNRGSCYIRVGNSSRPASRDTIISLCRNTIDRTSSVEVLHVTASLLKQELTTIAEQGLHFQIPIYKYQVLEEGDNVNRDVKHY
jgi:predicted HTH transcriptional regulator